MENYNTDHASINDGAVADPVAIVTDKAADAAETAVQTESASDNPSPALPKDLYETAAAGDVSATTGSTALTAESSNTLNSGTSLPLPIPPPYVPKSPEPPPADAPSKHISIRSIIRAVASLASVSVFMLAMYVEISAAVAAFIPDGLSSAAAQLAFGGNYASAEPPGDDTTQEPPRNDDDYSDAHGADINGEITSGDDSAESESLPNDADQTATRYPIVSRDLSTKAERGLTCSNQTDYELDLNYFADNAYTLPPLEELTASYPPDTENPVVLIIHTHGTESYAEEGADSYSIKDNSRTTDTEKNVVAVGEVMAQYFEEHGIKTIHCTEMFDRDSYIDAYTNSSDAVREYLAIYPSIRYIFDVHRDSIIGDDYTKYRPVTEINGIPTAQFMCVVGTNAKGANHPGWRDNLTLAAHLQVRLWNVSPSLPRRLSIRSASFYQQYAPGSLLLEIGSCGNTLSEAKACALLVAQELTDIIIAGE